MYTYFFLFLRFFKWINQFISRTNIFDFSLFFFILLHRKCRFSVIVLKMSPIYRFCSYLFSHLYKYGLLFVCCFRLVAHKAFDSCLFYFLVCRAFESQSIAWSSPSPFVADVLKICPKWKWMECKISRMNHGHTFIADGMEWNHTWNVRFFNASKPSAWCTSAKLIHPSMSCLFANTTKIAPASSSSCNRKTQQRVWWVTNEISFGGNATYPQHIQQFIFWNTYSIPIGRIDYINNCICVTVIASPIWSNAGLSAQIPYLKF